MLKKLVQLITATILILSIVGCGAKQPKPYSMKINNFNDISEDEKKLLLIKSMMSIPQFHLSKKPKNSSSSSSMDGNVISYHGVNAIFAHKFEFDNNTNKLYRIDVSKGVIGQSYVLTHDNGFSDYINDFQEKLGMKFKSNLQAYEDFKRKLLSYKTTFKHTKEIVDFKISQLHFSIKDNTKLLKKKDIDKLLKYVTVTKKVSPEAGIFSQEPIVLFLADQTKFPDIDNLFSIKAYLKHNIIGRYMVTYTPKEYFDTYKKFPLDLTFTINEAFFNYLPKKYISKDANIDFEVINKPFSRSHSLDYIKITNKTQEFVVIDTISAYYGNNVSDNILDMKKIEIPPMSYKVFHRGSKSVFDFPTRKFIYVENKNQTIHYGFSVRYTISNRVKDRNLYKVIKYSLKDFQ